MIRCCIASLLLLTTFCSTGCQQQQQRSSMWDWIPSFGATRIPAPANGTYQISGQANPPATNSYYNPGGSTPAQPASHRGAPPASNASFQNTGWHETGTGRSGNSSNSNNQGSNGNRTSNQFNNSGTTPVTVASATDSSRLPLNDASNVQVPSQFQRNNDFRMVGGLSNQPSNNAIRIGNRGSFEATGSARIANSINARLAIDPYRNAQPQQRVVNQNQFNNTVAPASHTGNSTTHSNVLATSTTNTGASTNTTTNTGWTTSNPNNGFRR